MLLKKLITVHFTTLNVKHFGPFINAHFEFERMRVNWVTGANASGKTQLAGALLAALVGRPALKLDESGVGPAEVEVLINDDVGQAQERLTLNVGLDADGKVAVTRNAGPLSLSLLAALSDAGGQQLVVNLRGGLPRELPEPKEIEHLLPDALRRRADWFRLRESGAFSASASEGQRSIAMLVSQLAARLRAQVAIPLVLDDWNTSWWDPQTDQLARAVLDEILLVSQVIVLSPDPSMFGSVLHHATLWDHSVMPIAWFDYGYLERRPNLRRRPKTAWVLGSKLRLQESRTCEYKEVKGTHALESIKSTVDQYVVAFMNAGVTQEGAIYWGVRDEDHVITGVQLTLQQCDELKRVVTERLHQIVPPIAPTAYRIELHAVSEGSRAVPDTYVVEVRVPSVRRTLLFATGRQEVYVKTDAGKRKLTVVEIQQELIKRFGLDPEF